MDVGIRVVHETDVPMETAPMGQGVRLRWVISRRDGAPRYAMRVFEVEPGGEIPLHHHWYEQEMYVLEGEGTVGDGRSEQVLGPGSVIYVPPDQPHQMRNTGSGKLRFICVIPHPDRGSS
ncbi:cupin domain-containing protein [Carboxydochorda subterranea]|uniref:Cupin domain-containing protein n=1 Tax=Carboxydichorda subterranea TaxID=3109565 RepID=A0ABZ1BU67_9FIRM|nr:cupin domain-containing protein [Limnochorda sp. L945t]WRP16025.1 cupin domain-containing protein [Limnochorda sp. L945t]